MSSLSFTNGGVEEAFFYKKKMLHCSRIQKHLAAIKSQEKK